MEYCWGWSIVYYPITTEGRAVFIKHMWAFIELVGNYDIDNINNLLRSFEPVLADFPQ
jgi:hypothetical protein